MSSHKEGVESEEMGERRQSPEEHLFVKDNKVTKKKQPMGQKEYPGLVSLVLMLQNDPPN